MSIDQPTPKEIPVLTDAELARECAERVMGWRYNASEAVWENSVGEFVWNGPSWRISLKCAAACTDRLIEQGWYFQFTAQPRAYRAKGFFWGPPYRETELIQHERRERAEFEACLRAAGKNRE